MKIATFLERNDVTVAVPLGGKKEVLSALVDLIVSNHSKLERDQLLQILLKREELRSTAIELPDTSAWIVPLLIMSMLLAPMFPPPPRIV